MERKALLYAVIVCLLAISSAALSRDDKIYGGSLVTDIREMPWMVNVQAQSTRASNGVICGGTLVTTLYVITACHCLFSPPKVTGGAVVQELINPELDFWYFMAGATVMIDAPLLGRSKLPANAQLRTPAVLLHHPECAAPACPGCFLKDMGLAKMTKPFTITDFVKPLAITLDSQEFENQLKELADLQQRGQLSQCSISGWGVTGKQPIVVPDNWVPPPRNPEVDNLLRTMTFKMYTLDPEVCIKWIDAAYQAEGGSRDQMDINEEKQVLPGDICTLGEDKGQGWTSACSGDSGGGFICKGSKVQMFGPLSFGHGCGTRMPKTFQALNTGIDWLKSELCRVGSCQDLSALHEKCTKPESAVKNCADKRGLDEPATGGPVSSSGIRLCTTAMMLMLGSLLM